LRGDLIGERVIKTSLYIDVSQFGVLASAIRRQFLAFPVEIGALGVRLRADGDVLAGGHRHRARYQTRDPRDEDAAAASVGCRHTDDQTRGGDQPVIRPEDGRPEPADTVGAMHFGLFDHEELVTGRRPGSKL